MIKPWTYRNTQSKLNIFISSRIEECSLERRIIKKAILDIYHTPILFEHLGSRSYSPRDLYLSHLDDSNLMIGVYKTGYGFVATDMEISGIEDEYQFAKKKNIPSLFYIHEDETDRDLKLKSLISDIKGAQFTVSYYLDPSELEVKVKHDLTAEIASGYLKSDSRSDVLEESAENVLSRTKLKYGVPIGFRAVLEEVIKLSEKNNILCIYGPPGSGKTTLTAQLAVDMNAVYVRATNLAPKDLFIICASAINQLDETHSSATDLESAKYEFLEAWKEKEAITLIIDESEFIQEVIGIITLEAEFNNKKKLIYTSYENSLNHSSYSLSQSTSFINHNESSTTSSASIQKFDLAQLNGSAKEVFHYLVLNSQPLTAKQILILRGDDAYVITDLYDDVVKFNDLIDDGPRGFKIIDDVISQKVCDELKKSSQLYRFYLNRLVKLWEDEDNYRQVYWLATLLNDGTEKKYQALAAIEASKLGDWKLGVDILNKMLVEAKDIESKLEAFDLMLSLIYPLELLGQVQKSNSLLAEAQTLATELGSSEKYRIKEIEVSARARKGIEIKDVEALKEIYEHYAQKNMHWDRARIGIELSALYISAKEYEAARDVLELSLPTFKELEDYYGIDIAEKNLVSALTAMDGNEKYIQSLLNSIELRNKDISDQRRQRAWICNIQTRRLRKAKKFKKAEELAREAIALAKDLGDESLTALNLINLGNIYRDRKLADEALETYKAAAASAIACGRKDIEADASRLSANILNDLSNIKNDTKNSELAKNHALHAISLIKNGIGNESLAYSYCELGEAYEKLNQKLLSAEAYFDSAKIYSRVSDAEDSFEYALNAACRLALADHPVEYLQGLALVLGKTNMQQDMPLIDSFLKMIPDIVTATPKGSLIHLLGSHLYTVWSNTPPPFRGALILRAMEKLGDTIKENEFELAKWRVLYSGIVFMYLLKEKSEPFMSYELAKYITDDVGDIFFREEGDASRAWTVILDLNIRVSVSIVAFDKSHETNIACFALALFIKAFENEMKLEIITGGTLIRELSIHIGRYDMLPPTFQKSILKFINIEEILEAQQCSVSRPVDFIESNPTLIFLSNKFLSEFAFGEGRGGSLQTLFGLTLIEVAYQLLRGEVDYEILRPKIISLVRKTIH